MLKNLARKVMDEAHAILHRFDAKNPVLNQQLQRVLWSQYRSDLARGLATHGNELREAGFRCYSQFEEDGIILYLLALIGLGNRTVVEIGCGNGRECMATNLIVNHGFAGFLFDGDATNVARARRFFATQKDCMVMPPVVTQAWVTRDNVDALIRESGAEGEVDVLSIDVDGNDYHFWEAIEAIRPRLCVFETHDLIPAGLSLTVPYREELDAMREPDESDQWFRSVSLDAMVKLSRRKGYTLVGAHRHGFNVFFVRDDLLGEHLHETSVEAVHDNPWTRHAQRTLWPRVKDRPWVEV